MLECQFQVKYLNLKCSAQFPWQHHYNKIVRLNSKVCSLNVSCDWLSAGLVDGV